MSWFQAPGAADGLADQIRSIIQAKTVDLQLVRLAIELDSAWPQRPSWRIEWLSWIVESAVWWQLGVT